jgi:hypothetical protein
MRIAPAPGHPCESLPRFPRRFIRSSCGFCLHLSRSHPLSLNAPLESQLMVAHPGRERSESDPDGESTTRLAPWVEILRRDLAEPRPQSPSQRDRQCLGHGTSL